MMSKAKTKAPGKLECRAIFNAFIEAEQALIVPRIQNGKLLSTYNNIRDAIKDLFMASPTEAAVSMLQYRRCGAPAPSWLSTGRNSRKMALC